MALSKLIIMVFLYFSATTFGCIDEFQTLSPSQIEATQKSNLKFVLQTYPDYFAELLDNRDIANEVNPDHFKNHANYVEATHRENGFTVILFIPNLPADLNSSYLNSRDANTAKYFSKDLEKPPFFQLKLFKRWLKERSLHTHGNASHLPAGIYDLWDGRTVELINSHLDSFLWIHPRLTGKQTVQQLLNDLK